MTISKMAKTAARPLSTTTIRCAEALARWRATLAPITPPPRHGSPANAAMGDPPRCECTGCAHFWSGHNTLHFWKVHNTLHDETTRQTRTQHIQQMTKKRCKKNTHQWHPHTSAPPPQGHQVGSGLQTMTHQHRSLVVLGITGRTGFSGGFPGAGLRKMGLLVGIGLGLEFRPEVVQFWAIWDKFGPRNSKPNPIALEIT